MPKFIRCADGSYLNVQHVTRLSVTSDYDDKWNIMASTVTGAMPYTVLRFTTVEETDAALDLLVSQLEES